MHKRRLFTFKYKLSLLIFSAVIMVSSFLGLCQYTYTKSILEEDYKKCRELIKDKVASNLNNADSMYLMAEEQLEKDAKKIAEAVSLKYSKEKNISFDLAEFVKGKSGFDLYIIDESNKIVASTDYKDIGIDFNKYPRFLKILEKIRDDKKFAADRLSLSIKESSIKKFCYMPSNDNKYIFEVGIQMSHYRSMIKGIGFENFDDGIIAGNDFVHSVTLFTDNGDSYNKYADMLPVRIMSENKKYLKQAIKNMEPVEIIGKHSGKKAIYSYIPYELKNSIGGNQFNVIEIIYDYSWLQKGMENSIKSTMLAVLFGTAISIAFGFYQALRISEPIELMVKATNEAAAGNLDIKTNVMSNDEFEILSKSFDRMTSNIKELLEERYKREQELERINIETQQQKEEINSLYEETAAINEELEGLLTENHRNYLETVKSLANAIEAKDSYTGGHCERVTEYSVLIGEKIGLDSCEMLELKYGSILHDIGKIGIKEEVLNKKEKFTDDDYALVKKHPSIGFSILDDMHFLGRSKRVVLEHHERFDGKGYPAGLKGDEIDFLARIVCVADAYDAMTSSRSYRTAPLTQEQAIGELIKNKGTQFDEQVVDSFVGLLMGIGDNGI